MAESRALLSLLAGPLALAAALVLLPLRPAAADDLSFALGHAVFERFWVAGGASTQSADGLGPLYNARSCAGCHAGAGPSRVTRAADGTLSGPGLLVRLGTDTGDIDPVYGRQIQPRAVPGVPAEAAVVLSEEPVRPGEPGPRVGLRLEGLAYGALAPQTGAGVRIGPELAGRAALGRIDEAAILALADPDDADGDGISGRPNRIVMPDGSRQTGRYGWRAAHPTLADQVASAFADDMGLSSRLRPRPWGDCTPAQTACRAARHGDRDAISETEVSDEMFALVLAYLDGLDSPSHEAKPRRAAAAGRAEPAPAPGPAGDGRAGAARGPALFAATGCAACHVPALPARDGGMVNAFSDLLLHDMGAGLADPAVQGEATAREWRTAPLIGLASGKPGTRRYLHDGRADSLQTAIGWHDGEAAAARRAFGALSPGDRAALLAYLGEL